MSHTSAVHTYHCLCSTLLLATPYPISHLQRRAPPSLDHAYILPLPPLSSRTSDTTPVADVNHNNLIPTERQSDNENVLPSLLTPNVRPARKSVVVRRSDGFEKRKVLRCGRCGIGVGYEIIGVEVAAQGGDRGRVVYLLEGGLVETEDMGKEDGGL